MRFMRRMSMGAVGALATTAMLVAAAPTAFAQGKGYQWPKHFTVVTPVVGTANHSLAVAWTSKFQAATGARVAVLPAPNGFARAAWLNSGEGRISMLQASDYFDQMDGIQGYATKNAGPSDTRVMNLNMVTGWGYVVRGDSKIKSFDDVGPGTRIALAKSSSFLVAGIDALLAYRGLRPQDVNLVEVGSFGANTAVLAEGRVDVTFTSPLSGPSYQAEAAPNGLRWLELPPREKNPAAYEKYRAIMSGYIPQSTTAGVKSAQGVRMDHAFQVNHVRADEDPEFVYQLLRWLDVSHDSYKADFTHAHMMTVQNLVAFLDQGALQPLHEGAIRYLKEKGVWKDSYQARQDQLVKLAQARAKVYQAAVAAAEKKGISIDPGNEKWVAFWNDHRKANGHARSFGEDVLSLK